MNDLGALALCDDLDDEDNNSTFATDKNSHDGTKLVRSSDSPSSSSLGSHVSAIAIDSKNSRVSMALDNVMNDLDNLVSALPESPSVKSNLPTSSSIPVSAAVESGTGIAEDSSMDTNMHQKYLSLKKSKVSSNSEKGTED